jgi:hypothetical protein
MTAPYLSREPAMADFVGRRAELAWLTAQLGRDEPQNCNVVGEPRIGKTSLLYQAYAQQAGARAGDNYIWVRLSEFSERSAAGLWKHLASSLAARDDRALDGGGTLAGDTSEFETLQTYVEAIERKNGRLIFVIDNFELLLPALAGQGLDQLRALITRFTRCLAFVISSTDQLYGVEGSAVSPVFNVFQGLQLGLLATDETEQLLDKSLEQASTLAESPGPWGGSPVLSSEDRAFLIGEAGRHPALLKIACGYLLQGRQEQVAGAPTAQLYTDVESDFRYDGQVRWLCEKLMERVQRNEEAWHNLCSLATGAGGTDPIVLRRLSRLGLLARRPSAQRGAPELFCAAFAYWVRKKPGPVDDEQRVPSRPAVDYDPELRQVRTAGGFVELTPTEGRLLSYLLSKPNVVCPPQELLANVWGPGKSPSVVEKSINRLRAKVESDPARPHIILSLRGEGYVLRTGDGR